MYIVVFMHKHDEYTENSVYDHPPPCSDQPLIATGFSKSRLTGMFYRATLYYGRGRSDP